MLIERVAEGSPASKAGLRGGSTEALVGGNPVTLGGDLIVKVFELEAGETEKIGAALARLKAGDKVQYTLLREGKLVQAEVEVPVQVSVPRLSAPPKR